MIIHSYLPMPFNMTNIVLCMVTRNNRTQKVIGTLLYYGTAVYSSIIPYLRKLGTTQANPATKRTPSSTTSCTTSIFTYTSLYAIRQSVWCFIYKVAHCNFRKARNNRGQVGIVTFRDPSKNLPPPPPSSHLTTEPSTYLVQYSRM